MYEFGEGLQSPLLLAAAHAKMVEILLYKSALTPKDLAKIVEWVHGSDNDSAAKICVDQDGTLKDLVVGSVLRHEKR
jgi:hypothetical protein